MSIFWLTPASRRDTSEKRCDGRGNCEIERARFRYLDEAGAERTGEIIDVYLSAR